MVKIELVCSCCGQTLEYRPSEDGIQGNTFYVTPCDVCGYDEYMNGRERGRKDISCFNEDY